ncbi:tyrosine-type recombinase/integrase [Geoalkalibacter sp.]|uniref:tyrosine-type recombinase/integrase n=1 Tax=Geoalkalibacter sp. TaxID=3041440 RepID=UPI00272E1430|nr:site-specific integrase [Geoalkalibacter sp.]
MSKAKNSKGIYRRGKVWWITYQGLDGKQHFESSGSQLKADAEYLLACRRKAIGEGTAPPVTGRRAMNTTFAELADRYLEFVAGQKAVAAKRIFIRELKNEFGAVKLNALTLSAVETWQARLLTQPRPGRAANTTRGPLSVASVNRHLACLKHMLTKAHEWDLIGRDAADRLCRAKLKKEENRRSRFLSLPEIHELIAAAEGHLKPVLVFALNTGCRKGEILGLTWDRVDLKHGFIHLDKTKSGHGRDIPINATLRECLKGLVRRLDTNLVFYNPATGGRWHDLKRSFATACRRAKIHDFHFHDLRHTFASHLVMAGVDLTTVSRLLGHASLTMTLRYSHLAPDHLKGAVDVLARLQGAADAHEAKTKSARR